MRSGQQPYALVEEGKLAIRGLPIDLDTEAWAARHPPQIQSFLAARLVQLYRAYAADGDRYESSYRREEKRAVCALLFERIERFVRERGRPLLFVLFDPHQRIERPGWRERFCRETFERLDVPWVDACAVLQREADVRGVPVVSFFRKDNHPNAEGNDLIAREIAAKLVELGWVGAARDAEK
jgi:hypothetical protein